MGTQNRGRGSKEWTQTVSSQRHLDLRPPPHPMCVLGCLMQTGELMIFAVTPLLPNTAVTGKGTGGKVALAGWAQPVVMLVEGGEGAWVAVRSPPGF